MRVGFVNTSGKQNVKPFRIDPLGSLLLLTVLEQEFGDSLELSFTDLRCVAEDSLTYHIPEKDIYLHYVTSPEFREISNIVADLRKFYPKAIHFGGGPHCNIFPEESSQIFDAICIGEGEEVIKHMVRDAMNQSLKKVYREIHRIDINMYPYPQRKYLAKPAVVDVGLLTREHYDLLGTSAIFSRGCPFSCHFCSNQYPGPIRSRSPELITNEIEYLKAEYGIKALLIKDDQGIPVPRNQAVRNIEAISKADIMWRAQTRANAIEAHVIKLAKEAGCVEIAVAIESVWQKSLDIMNKKIDLSKAEKYLNELKKADMDVKILLILGLPGEPKDIAQRTIDFIEEFEPNNVVLSMLCPIPGSEIYRHPERFGMKINPDVPFDKYFFSFGRFDEDEEAPHFFDYEKETPFGRGMSMDEILGNHEKVQTYLREYDVNF